MPPHACELGPQSCTRAAHSAGSESRTIQIETSRSNDSSRSFKVDSVNNQTGQETRSIFEWMIGPEGRRVNQESMCRYEHVSWTNERQEEVKDFE